MRITNITSANFKFKSGQKYVLKETKENIQTLLQMMNKDTKYTENREHTVYNSDILASLSLGKKIKFSDDRLYICPENKYEKQQAGEEGKNFICDCSIKIGKNRLNINSKSGEIVGYKLGVFTTWRYMLQKVDETITTFLANFNNNSVVTKNRFKIQGFTQKEIERLQRHT